MKPKPAIPATVLWREIAASRRRKIIGAVLLMAVTVLALLAGYHIVSERAQAQQKVVAQDIDDAIDRIVSETRAGERKLANLAGRPCSEVQTQLTLKDVSVPYRRTAMLVKDGSAYCSTVRGPVSIPLASYLVPTGDAQQIAFLGGTQLIPGTPVMAIYAPVDSRHGVLYIVEGAYVVDILARAKASGAKSASVSDGTGGTLTSDGRFLKTAARESSMSEIVVGVERDGDKLRADLIATEVLALFIGLFVFATLLAGYIAGFTPRQRLERQVRAGLRRNEFYVEYQAIVDLESGQWVGAEALLRWKHPRLGLVLPGKFIGEIEMTTVIAPLTEFVLATALTELDACEFPDGFRVNVNLAPKHIEMHCFPHDISSTLKRSPTRFQVVLEITERGLLTGLANSHENLMNLKTYGVKFAVDDFGTDNSNLALLQRFAFDFIKIDRQFTDGVANQSRQLVEGITYLANKLDLTIVAEGVEEVEQRDALKEIGIRFAQGFLFQRPANILEFERMYRHSQVRVHAPSQTHWEERAIVKR
ncbi:EAL domain-containing protein [Paraburkholderia sp. BL10I2N1]|uniref:EAL domain-containing protein n=1 Tax=Paraburkholderia sp. BL10I2N1 TaxID=1938796 RepID=UPI0010D82943|nr:EAL domain-containing protein [Paraburkholderia sp. BL10I2N1]TDN67036.1 diguanylate phosphodiesterase [Paraburkholderia sp. BL10I2N1]